MVLRSLGSDKERRRFQTLLIEMLDKNNIEYVKVDPPDYDERFLRCVELVRELLMMQSKAYRISIFKNAINWRFYL